MARRAVLGGEFRHSGAARPSPPNRRGSRRTAGGAAAADRQGEGIGGRLVRAVLDRAAQNGWQGVFVLGDPAYYCRFGFDRAPARGFASPYAGPHLMARTLVATLPARTGRIDYAPAFARFA